MAGWITRRLRKKGIWMVALRMTITANEKLSAGVCVQSIVVARVGWMGGRWVGDRQ